MTLKKVFFYFSITSFFFLSCTQVKEKNNLSDSDNLKDTTKAAYYLNLSDKYFVANKTGKAKDALEKALKMEANNIEVLMKLAELYLYVEKHQESINYVNKVLQIDQYNSKAYFIKGMNYKEIGDTSKAISSMQTAVEQDPDYYAAYMQLGILNAAKKNPIALDYYNNALKINPASKEAYYAKGKFFQDMSQWKTAIETYQELLRLDPDFKNAYYNLGVIYFLHLKLFDKSISFFDEAIRTDPQYAEAFFARGTCYQAMGNMDRASEDLKMAHKINPKISD